MKNSCITEAAALLSASLLLSSCHGANEAKLTETAAETTSETVTAAETELKPSVPEKDYSGASFHILTCNDPVYLKTVFSDEETGDSFADVVYRRMALVEEYFNIDVAYEAEIAETELYPAVNRTVLAGDNSYQLILTNNMRGNSEMLAGGMLLDWNSIASVDFSRPYWYGSIIDTLKIYGNNYLAKSMFVMPQYGVIVFSKPLAEQLKLDDPYSVVQSGKWTLDLFYDTAKAVTADVNGDGAMDINDRYGINIMADYPLNSFRAACGVPLTKLGADGLLEPDFYSERSITLFEKLYTIFCEDTVAWTFPWMSPIRQEETIQLDSGRVLYRFAMTSGLSAYREYETDYGIIPYPMLNEEQDGYHIDDYGRLMAIPQTVTDPELTGNVCEMLGFYSYTSVLPAYYENLLYQKICRENESVEMLELIAKGVTYDAGMTLFGLAGALQSFMYYPSNMVKSKSNDFASFYKSKESFVLSELDSFYKSIEK